MRCPFNFAPAANGVCGWLLHSKTFLIRFVHLSEAVMCPACLRGFDRWPSLSGHCSAIPCRAVDGFRKPSSYQLCGLSCPCHSTECLGFGGRLMHHHLAGLANSLCLFPLGCVRRVGFVAGQDCPDDPSCLVGHCDGCYARWFAFEQ